MIKNGWVRITRMNMCARIDVRDGIVVDTAPILKRFMGKKLSHVKKDIGKCDWIEYEEETLPGVYCDSCGEAMTEAEYSCGQCSHCKGEVVGEDTKDSDPMGYWMGRNK